MKMYELRPVDGRKSFYGKAIVTVNESNGEETLYSYGTPIVRRLKDGTLERFYLGWTQTTGRHIKAFCGLGKKEFFEIPHKVIK